jgi:hypothetical protein
MAHVDIVDRIKAITEGLGWVFTYGQVDVKNLIEASQAAELTPEEIHFLLLPVNRALGSNQYGKATTLNYDIAFSIFTPDQFDSIEEGEGKDYYWQKFNYKVRALLEALYYFQAHLVCPGIVLNIRRINEVYNDGTENLTGVFAEASASIDLDFDFGTLAPQPPLPPVNVFCELLVQCPAWISLEARVTALEQGGGGGGLTCAELINCEVIQEILGELVTLAEAVQAATNTANAAAEDAAQALALAGTAVQPGDLAAVATSGAYSDLSGTPSIPAAQIQSDWTQANNASLDFIKNKPSIPPTKLSINDVTRSSGSGIVVLQILRTITIPANTMPDGIYDLIGRVGKGTGATMSFFYFFGTTSADLTGCSLIATLLTGANNQLYLQMARRIAVASGTLYFFQATENALTDSARTTNAENTLAYNPAIENYLHVVITTGGNIAFNHSFTSLCQR